MTFILTEPPNPQIGDFELRKPKEGSQKVQTLLRLEWFPRKKTWRLIETKPTQTKTGTTQWKQITLADFGEINEGDARSMALTTLSLLGY